ncbi:hypothetical protein GCM10009067_06100 [Haloarcula sebkhae]|uniref:Uncharacterized protein n=1 Tax=Haloarcula sebkhae TaxID=932660 RepID=A0A830EG80_9EURY|nr:hypothetical protein GCM10009067_06100 [Haloarcula sebkhae]
MNVDVEIGPAATGVPVDVDVAFGPHHLVHHPLYFPEELIERVVTVIASHSYTPVRPSVSKAFGRT